MMRTCGQKEGNDRHRALLEGGEVKGGRGAANITIGYWL